VVITDVSPYRLELAEKVGVSLALNVAETSIAEGQRRLGLREGFDIGLEMSGRPEALREMIANMTHGGRIAMLGLPAEEFSVDFARIVTSMITLKGIYGREMYETWYQMSVLLQSGLDIKPVITHRFSYEDHETAFAAAASGDSGKVILDWSNA
jgi:threonine 3-dehydrogenase